MRYRTTEKAFRFDKKAFKRRRDALKDNWQALKGGKKAIKGDVDALKGDEEAFKCNRCIESWLGSINPFTADVAKRRPPGRPQMSPSGDIINYFF